MTTENNRKNNIFMLLLMTALTILVVVLYLVTPSIFGAFSLVFSLLPILIGAKLYGLLASAWLGFSFGVATLIRQDINLFMGMEPVVTVVMCLIMGAVVGLSVSFVYQVLSKKNETSATFISAIISPVVKIIILTPFALIFFGGFIQYMGKFGVFLEDPMVRDLVINISSDILAALIMSPISIIIVKIINKKIYNK